MIREFLGDLTELDFVSGAITVQHGERDQSKLFATLWFDQGQFLTPKALKTLKNGLQKYPIIFVKDAPPTTDERNVFADYHGDFWFKRASESRSRWSLRLENEDFATLTKFLDKENSHGQSTITFWVRWIDSERVVYQTGLVQAKEREGENFKTYDEP